MTVCVLFLTEFVTVYKTYFAAGRGAVTVPLILLAMILMQGSQVLNSYMLVWWEGKWVL
jgi:hypothetical protein